METSLLMLLWDIMLNLDQYLNYLIINYGAWIYLILFLVIFCETGLVVTPFLPGDSLIFVLGALAASGELEPLLIASLLITAAILGNLVNYQIGSYVGPKVFTDDGLRFMKKQYLLQTQHFYARHGGKAVFLGRFLPIIRTFAPFVAGIGRMGYRRFLFYNCTGSACWVLLFLGGGYSFGNIPAVEKNFTLVVFAIIFVSMLPAVYAFLKQRGQQTSVVAED